MFEEYQNKQVKIYASIGDRPFCFTGKLLEVDETHVKLLDKFGLEQLILIESIEQMTPMESDNRA